VQAADKSCINLRPAHIPLVKKLQVEALASVISNLFACISKPNMFPVTANSLQAPYSLCLFQNSAQLFEDC
jgi:hypothetical protein